MGFLMFQSNYSYFSQRLMFGSVPLIQSVCCSLSVYFFYFNLASKLFNFFSIFIHNYRVSYSK